MGRCASCAIKRRASFDVLHLKREMRSKSLIFMDLHNATPSEPATKHAPEWHGLNRHLVDGQTEQAGGFYQASRLPPHRARSAGNAVSCGHAPPCMVCRI